MANSTSVALARKEAEIARREVAFRAGRQIQNAKEQASLALVKAKAAVESIKDSSSAAIATNGAARLGGMAIESYARRKLAPEKSKLIGPIATVGAVVAYTLGMQEKKAATQYAYFSAAGLCEGAASRFLLEQMDRATDGL